MTVRNRDAGRCLNCGESEKMGRLSVHHIVPDAEVPSDLDSHLPVNLASLCKSCHSALETKSDDLQLFELNIDDPEELLLSQRARRNLNTRLDNIGPEELTVKKVPEDESRRFLDNHLGVDSEQTSFSAFHE